MSSRRSLGVAKMAGVALAAFGFAFALVPLYRIACEKVFGVRLEQGHRRVSLAQQRTIAAQGLRGLGGQHRAQGQCSRQQLQGLSACA